MIVGFIPSTGVPCRAIMDTDPSPYLYDRTYFSNAEESLRCQCTHHVAQISELTELQKQQLEIVGEHSLKMQHSTKPIDQRQIEQAIKLLYKGFEYAPPEIFWCESP